MRANKSTPLLQVTSLGEYLPLLTPDVQGCQED